MNIVAIIQARMGSTRLPGKILKKVLGKPLLQYQLERIRRSKFLTNIVIATTTNTNEQPIIDLCNKGSVDYFCGSELDVLSRYFEAAKHYHADLIVRITSDCPVIDPEVIDIVVKKYLDNIEDLDYASNTLERTFPRGMDIEIFSFQALEEAFYNADLDYQREHVTPFIYQQSERFRLANVYYTSDLSKHRWTVDTIEDFNLISNIIEKLYLMKREFTLIDILNLFEKYPEMFNINSNIKQKDFGE